MGTYCVGEGSQHPFDSSEINFSVPARNLSRNELGSVIFGCTHDTIEECLSNGIFGLPSLHFPYIKNIHPGMPLFLFNYCDKKLHGIFEATTHGQMNINPYGWAEDEDGSERTKYPAQVRIRIRMQCRSLSETRYKPIIIDNYYSAFHFWFELDQAQTFHLISLFESLPPIHSTISGFPDNASKWNPKHPLVARNEDEIPNGFHALVSDEEIPCLNHSNICMDEGNRTPKEQESHLHKEVVESVEQRLYQLQQLNIGKVCSKSYQDDHEKVIDDPRVTNDIHSGDGCSPEAPSVGHEDFDVPSATNFSAPARNLRKNELGSVIFGCTHNTIEECLSNQIFGLPSLHFSHIKNIQPGMPLFLFNYSDKKLHGIFEAASHGQMNTNPYGWSEDGSERTKYPAQVHIRIRMQCRPLSETQYKPIINDNYYNAFHFRFELDHAQTGHLISLFESLPAIHSTISGFPKNAFKGKPKHPLVARNEDESPKGFHALVSDEEIPCLNHSNICMDEGNRTPKEQESHLDKEVVESVEQRLYQLQQCKVCCKSYQDGHEKVIDDPRVTNDIHSGDGCSPEAPSVGHEDVPSATSDKLLEEDCSIEAPFVSSHKLEEISVNQRDHQSLIDQLRKEVGELKAFSLEQLRKTSILEENLSESKFQVQQLKLRVEQIESVLSPSTTCIEDEPSDDVHTVNQTLRELSDEPQLGVAEMVFVIGGFDGISWLSALDRYSPSRDIMKSLKPMSSTRSLASSATLNGDIYVFGGRDGTLWYDTVESYSPFRNEWTSLPPLDDRKGSLAGVTLHNKIFAIGGGNGVESFSDVELFDPALGSWIHTRPMLHKRFAHAAAELNGVIYVVGGFDENNYLKSTERYDPREASWSRLQNMSTRRGCHSLAVLNEKIYALGGYDGTQIVPSVEVFDPRTGSWMAGEEMKSSRGYSVAAVIGEALYVIGGMYQSTTLNTVECFKEGHGWEMTNMKGVGKRCFSTVVVL